MVHQYKLNGYNVVIDVYSGGIHVVDDVAYDIIHLFRDKTLEEIIPIVLEGHGDSVSRRDIEECYEDICTLRDQGKLFAEDEFGPSADMLKSRNTDIKALCLHVSHACDLTCSYCFAGQGRFNGPSALMSAEVGKRAIDFLIENSGSRVNLEVDFFGGEPLLNFDVVREVTEYARSIEKEAGKNFRFTLTTNGMGITDEVIDFCNRECHNVVLSLDGRREIHDRERRTAGGEGSYDTIVPKFQRLVYYRTNPEAGTNPSTMSETFAAGADNSSTNEIFAAGDRPITRGVDTGNTNYYIRGTYTHYNPDFTNDIYHMTELGFDELSMEPVVADSSSPFALTESDFEILVEQYEDLAKEMIRRSRDRSAEWGKQPFNFYHYLLDLGHGPCIYKRISGCGSGTEYFAVTPQGDLYPCHQFVGDNAYLMGNIWEGITQEDVRTEFKQCNVYARPQCDDCWAKLYCSGGCAANAYHSSGSVLGVYDYGCRLFKKRIECAIMMQIAELENTYEDQ